MTGGSKTIDWTAQSGQLSITPPGKSRDSVMTTLPNWSASTSTFIEQSRIGPCTSLMVTLNVQSAELPALSVAVQVTGVVPTGKKCVKLMCVLPPMPSGIVQATAGNGSQLSSTPTINETSAPQNWGRWAV